MYGDNSDYIAIRSTLPTKEVATTVRTILMTLDPDLTAEVVSIHPVGECDRVKVAAFCERTHPMPDQP